MKKSDDTGGRLRNLYAAAGGPRAVFSSKVADYAASRPDYPPALFAYLQARCPAAKAKLVADVGSGTGLLTQGLLRCGYRVVAVEPNSAMRAASDRLFCGDAFYHSVEGGAENIPLPDASVSLITVAQAFHWFEVGQARIEFLRVLASEGVVALVWNDRALDDPLQQALDDVFAEFGGAKRGALLAHEDRSGVPAFFGQTQPEQLTWPHAHLLDEAGLLSLVFSRSYMPARTTPKGLRAVGHVQRIFHNFQQGGKVTVRYRTILFAGLLKRGAR